MSSDPNGSIFTIKHCQPLNILNAFSELCPRFVEGGDKQMFMDIFGDRMQGSCTNEVTSSSRQGPGPALGPWKLLRFKWINLDSPCCCVPFKVICEMYNIYSLQLSFYYMIKYLAVSCIHKHGITILIPLKPPAKVLKMHGQEIVVLWKYGMKLYQSK